MTRFRLSTGGLAVKFVLPSLVVAGLATMLGSVLLQRRLTSDRELELLQHSQTLVQTLLYGVENLTRPDELERFLLVAGGGRDVKGLWLVCGSPPHVVLSTHIEERGMELEELEARYPGILQQSLRTEGSHIPAGLLFRGPIELSRDLRDLGTMIPAELLVLMDTASQEAQEDHFARHFLITRIVVLVVLLLSLGFVTHVVVLRPISRLQKQVRDVEAGAPPERIQVEGWDELGQLAQTVRRALSELREERSRFQLVAERNPGLIYRCRNDDSWTMEYMSRAALDLTGHPPEDFIGNARLDYESVIALEDREHVRIGVERGLAGDRTWDLEYRLLHANGSQRLVREQGRGHLDPATGDWVLDGIILDQSQRLHEEGLARRLVELEEVRQAGLRTLAGSVAHHFNNLLMGLMGNLELALIDLESGKSPHQDLVDCQQISSRAAALSRLMLLYVGEGEQNLRPVLLASFVQSQLSVRRFAQRLTPRLELEGTPGLDRLSGNEDLLTQLLDQLLDNAQEASPGAEEQIRLRAGCRVFREEELAQAQIPIHPDPEGNPFLEVLDNGTGMPPEVLERAFDPFFTTRFTGRGLGLAAVAGIVRVHRGGLCCRSREGAGTQLLVLFPRHPLGS